MGFLLSKFCCSPVSHSGVPMTTTNSIKFSSRLHLNRYGLYGFRLVIPKRLRVLFEQSEYRISLKTRNKELAKSRAFKLITLVNASFERIRMAVNFDDVVKEAQELVQSLKLQNFDENLTFLQNLHEVASDLHKQPLSRLIDLRKKDNECKLQIYALLEKLALDIASCNSDNEVDSVTCDFYAEITPLKNQEAVISNELNQLTLDMQSLLQTEINEANVDEIKQEFKSDKEKLAQFTSEMLASMSRSSPNQQQHATPSETDLNEPKPLLSSVIEAYSSNQLAEGKWSPKTEDTVNEIFRMWLRIVGDMPIAEYGFEKHREYKAILQKLPPNINKSPQFKNKTIAEVLDLNETPAASHTINKKLARVSSLFEWAISYGYVTLNPAKGMTIKSPKLARDERKVFSNDDLSKLFGSEVFIEKKYKHSYYYWLPLLALYTGARLNELCQLHLKDFDIVDGINVIKINGDMPDKRLKTKAAVREVPIHSELIRIGLLDNVNKLRKRNAIRLFPELTLGRDGYGHATSKWFARYRVKCGIEEQGKVFHSFRHTFINELKQNDVSKEKIAALVGHEDESETFGRYGKKFHSKSLYKVIENLSFKVVSN